MKHLSEKSNRLHVALINSYTAHKKNSFQEFQKLNLSTGHPKVLTVLYQNEGYLQKDLAKRCHVEPATMTSLLNNMERKELIYREAAYVSGGKRANAIYLTDKGRDLAIKVIKIVDDMEEICFKDFSDKEKRTLMDLLKRIEANLENK